ncbi:hypothetical protein BGZ80_005055 [Entomortierella chlamydospora]|uniref:BHLH domain-containing protein n=1 Tax=Entomortierella chlamydospora TaxID=101097 RepID=A0A9P6MLS1_9FUNG|nr:hypothetical protein BGZ80_005055 [Entomortierella chlamydospora]
MSPEDPKLQSPGDSGSMVEHSNASSGRTSSKSSTGSQQLPTFGDLSKPSTTSGFSSSSSSSSSRSLHTLYPNSTPPMSPGHVLISPVSRPHCGITDPSQYSSSSSSSFYQLPPPLQPFAPRQSPHQSPAIQPQSSQGHSLPSLPPLPSSAHPNGYSPRTTPQIPNNDPLILKQSIPAMILPDSALSSSPSSHETTSRSYSTVMPHRDTEMSSPTSAPVADQSAPSSPRRFVMLPPQSIPTTTTSHRSSRSQTRKASVGSSTGSSSTSAPTSPPARRRTSSVKLIDQETRDLMRKVSHSAIERRRRERINDKILQLKHLVPACVDEDHLHKLSILQSTIEYIQHLKSILPPSVANAKVGKATNNNPKNKTTDMLEAMGGSISAKSPLTPLMTTGLNHIYSKRIKVEKQEIRALLKDHAMSMSSSSSDEDAKDGLLLLAGQSSVAFVDDDDDDEQEDSRRSPRRKVPGSRKHD